jgi:hypothetical protein
MLQEIKGRITKHLSNMPGWRTNRRLIIIESDDWGSIRMPSLKAYRYLEENGIDVIGGDAKRYNQNDTLANQEDLCALFETLNGCKDKNRRAAVITAVSVVANPDFNRIKENNFQEYFHEPFTKTLEKYHGDSKAYDLWKEGIQNKIFLPQFHGREHLNIAVWMRALQSKDKEALLAFEAGIWGYNIKPNFNGSLSFQAAYDYYDPNDLVIQAASIKSGLSLFEDLFGYKATFFVPPNGPFNNQLEKVAAEAGIKYISASKIQLEPQGQGKIKKRLHWLGQKNNNDQIYITRNCFFEPSYEGRDWVNSCLSDISVSFKWNKPAVISSHRVNFIGGLNASNRDRGLKELKALLNAILNKWPDVEFLSSSELGDLIKSS